ncbi:MAG TPA: 3-hydroxyacyl-ACP dehydratase FabZ family protein [Phycisphaerae bacterium]|nr:3-hydroxyacyl-ACP dehydratase FabZ family protein [Phycisphaerae bacterium]HRW53181.1 3-hydroxyacyl-ACP dehydratase FabZ family protein [Phycisphaerae bacterium]
MPPAAIIEPSDLHCDSVVYDRDRIYELLPQRFEFSQLDSIILSDVENRLFAACRDVKADEWWCRGHMPTQAIFPGVLMVEAAAQLSAFTQKMLYPNDNGIMGFGGITDAKFRESIYPPARVILVARVTDDRARRYTCHVQSFVNGSMAFEGVIRGVALKI